MVKILLKRIYEEPSEADGYRILLDRLWPRGLKKEDAKFDEWRKDITPSKELRQWFHEDKDRHWEVFQGRYGMEIKQNPDFIPFLREIEKHPVVTFLTAAKDVQHSHHNALSPSLLAKAASGPAKASSKSRTTGYPQAA